MQEVMGPLPGVEKRVPLEVEVVEEHDEGTYHGRKIRYRSEPADRVPAWLLVPKGGEPGQKRPAALALHQTVTIGKDEPAGLGGLPTLRYGKELAERGFVVLAPDYPNFGEHAIDVYALGYASATMKAIWDNMRGVDLLASLPEVDPARIVAIGHSLGGHNTIFTSVFDDRIAAAVSSCGFNSFPYYYKGDLTGWSHKGYMPRIAERYGKDPGRLPFDFPELIGAQAPRGFFTNSPLHDSNFAVEGVRVAIAAARPVYDLHAAGDRLVASYPDAEHDFPDAQRQEAYRFLERIVGPPPAAGGRPTDSSP
jgi:acetyl esterase/lipase